MKMGFHTTGNSSTSRRTTQAVNLGYLRNRIASTTRKFNYCKEHSANPSLCINQFVNITPALTDGDLQVIVAENGSVFTSTDYGVNFTQYDISGNPPLFLVKTSYDGSHKVALDNNDNYLYVFSNNTWTQNSNQFFNINISSDGKYQTAATYFDPSGSLFRSTDYGNNWTQVSDVNFAITTSLSSSGQQQVVACAADIGGGIVYKSNNYGVTWTPTNIVTDQYAWICANISGDGSIITAGAFEGVIQYSRNNGATWTEATINWSTDPFFVGTICSSYNGQYQAFICQFNLAGNFPDFIYVSTDGGVTWNPANVPQLFYTSIAISNSGKIISAVANNDDGSYYYYKSVNYGQTFEEIPYEGTPILGIDIN